MKNRTTAVILTIVAALLCGCPGLIACIGGILVLVGVPFTTTVNGYSTTQALPIWYGVGGLCGSIILVAIPIVIGILTLRKKKGDKNAPVDVLPPSEPLPPAS
jgi:hypothetical protein